jgi:hypothetical protein
MKILWMLLVVVVILVSGVAMNLLPAIFNVVRGFFPVATAVFLFASTLGLVGRLRA